MLTISYSDHFLSVIRPPVHSSICPLTFSNDFPSEAAELILLKFQMELPQVGGKVLKWSRSVDQDGRHSHI